MARAFEKDEYGARQARFRSYLIASGIDVCLITAPESVCYLTGHATAGYYTYQALVFPADSDPVLVMRESEVINAQELTYFDDAQIEGYPDNVNPIAVTAKVMGRSASTRKVGLDLRSWFLTPSQYHTLMAELSPDETVSVDDEIGRLRLIKSAREIEAIRRAAMITNSAAKAAVATIVPGIRERDVAATIFETMVREGSEFLGMEPFVASGPRSGNIHASWSEREIRDGEPVLIELGAAVHRYHAALMHTVAVGRLPSDLQKVADSCTTARDKTVATIRPGATAEDCHKACVKTIDEAGLLDYYRKRTGYSIGIAFAPDWGEGAILSLGYGQETKLEPGMVVHAVPAIRIPGRGGVGLSATVLVTETGCEILTQVQNT